MLGGNMKGFYRILGLIMACIFCVTGCSSVGKNGETETAVSEYIVEDCRIVYGDGNQYGNEAIHAMNLGEKIKDTYGVDLKIESDYLESGEQYDDSAKEILVGHTAYSQSASAAERVTRMDYFITVDGNKVIIIAGSSDALGDGVEYFFENYLTKGEDGVLKLSTVEEFLGLYDYPHAETSAKIASLNLRYAHSGNDNNQSYREPRIYDFIKTERPDSFGVQECEKFWKERLEASIGKLGYVAAQEEAYSDSGKYAFKNYIWYNTKTTELIEGGRIWLSETPQEPSMGYGSRYYISAAWAILENKDTGARYVHVNTHLNVDSEKIRDKEVEVLMAKVRTFLNAGYEVFITGDFNSNMKSDVYKTMTKSLFDARYAANSTTNMYTLTDIPRKT